MNGPPRLLGGWEAVLRRIEVPECHGPASSTAACALAQRLTIQSVPKLHFHEHTDGCVA
jgi:hypothetical protein